MADQCIFCRIVAGEIPSTRVYSDDEFYAFRDIQPAAPTHVLLIPRQHIEKVIDAHDAGLMGRMLLTANKIAEQEGVADKGFRYVISCGPAGGQLVPHLHLHILGGRDLGWPPG